MCSVSRCRNKAAIRFVFCFVFSPIVTLLYIWRRIQYVGCDFLSFYESLSSADTCFFYEILPPSMTRVFILSQPSGRLIHTSTQCQSVASSTSSYHWNNGSVMTEHNLFVYPRLAPENLAFILMMVIMKACRARTGQRSVFGLWFKIELAFGLYIT